MRIEEKLKDLIPAVVGYDNIDGSGEIDVIRMNIEGGKLYVVSSIPLPSEGWKARRVLKCMTTAFGQAEELMGCWSCYHYRPKKCDKSLPGWPSVGVTCDEFIRESGADEEEREIDEIKSTGWICQN